MTPTVIIYILAGIIVAILAVLLVLGRDRYRLRERVGNLNQELIDVSADASVGRRLSEQGSGGIGSCIYAETQDDLFFAQGFNAARDRLFQLEMWRRTATGTWAEVLVEGPSKRDPGTPWRDRGPSF